MYYVQREIKRSNVDAATSVIFRSVKFWKQAFIFSLSAEISEKEN